MAHSTGRFSILAYLPGNPAFPTLPDPEAAPTGWSRIAFGRLGDHTAKRRSVPPRPSSGAPGILGGDGGNAHSGWYLNQIWVRPQPIDFGNIAGERRRTMTIFHTKRGALELTSIDLANVQPGVTIEGISLPRFIRPFTSIQFDTVAGVQGLAEFDAAVPFTFEDAEDIFPHIDSISPASVSDQTASQTVTITGENFTTNSVARFDGNDRDTTFTSATELSMELDAGDMDEIGEFTIRVFDPNRGQSNGKVFTVEPIQAVIANVSPSETDAEGDAVLTVSGTNIYPDSVVRWNGTDLATTYISGTELAATVLATDVQGTGAASVTVANPSPASESAAFSIPAPTLSDLDPDRRGEGQSGFTLTVTGSDFFPHAVVQWGGSDRPTTYISSSELQAEIPADDVTTPDTISITVVNPTPDGGTSGAETFTVAALTRDTFTADDSWTCPDGVTSVDILLVGGGGGGGINNGPSGNGHCGGGGGGGEVVQVFSVPVTPGNTYPITVGAGGNNSGRQNGEDSTALGHTALGGGGGGDGGSNETGADGGSGGGGGASTSSGAGGSSIAVEGAGSDGGSGAGDGNDNLRGAGGGGGAGEAGQDTIIREGGDGGDGLEVTDLVASPTYYGGGGGGGTNYNFSSGDPGFGGLGGGGNGAKGGGGSQDGEDGDPNTGGGGGGGNDNDDFSPGAGGSGIVILQYLE